MKVLLLGAGPGGNTGVFGTERVLHGLAVRLRRDGHDVHVAWHGAGTEADATMFSEDGIGVHIMPAGPSPSREDMFRHRIPVAPGLAKVMERVHPQIVQLFGMTAGAVHRRHVEIARAYGARVVLWHNVPGITCLQKGLLWRGHTPCDGEIRVQRCTECRLRAGAGLPPAISQAASRLGIGPLSRLLPHRAESVLGARRLTRLFQESCEQAFADLDRIQVGANWVRDVLSRNGAPSHKMTLIRPGVDRDDDSGAGAEAADVWGGEGVDRPLRLIYWGRIHRSKGLHTVIEALASRPELSVELAVFGDASPENAMAQALREQARGDERVGFLGSLAPEQVLPMLRTADVALVPSRWHETGPITVFEARAAGLPIIGSDRGGVGELCADDPGSIVFPAENAHALADVLAELVEHPERLAAMRQQVLPARTMDEVAADVAADYARLLESPTVRAAGPASP